MSEVRTMLTDVVFGESPRWHKGRLWFSDWGAGEVVAVDLDGEREVILRTPATPDLRVNEPTGCRVAPSASSGVH